MKGNFELYLADDKFRGSVLLMRRRISMPMSHAAAVLAAALIQDTSSES